MAAHANVDVTYALGCDIDSSSTEGFNEALQAVGEADAVVLVMGIDQSQEREGLDRTSITLPGVQKDLIEEVLSAATGTKLPLVLVIMAGGAVCLEPYKDDPRVGGILFVGYPGQ
ncbi:BXL6, partial [Symbiodinium microadriaticum]